jgi:xanthine/uracil/vitamin C permease (AzgA family)
MAPVGIKGHIDIKGRELILKARLLRLFALVFAVVGLIIFLVLYMQNVEGAFFSTMTDPFIVVIIVVPFLPAIVLSWLARRMERKYLIRKKRDARS